MKYKFIFQLDSTKTTYFFLEKVQLWNFNKLIKFNCIMIHFHVLTSQDKPS